MGFDIYGKTGNYFRASVWSWQPILAEITRLNTQRRLGLNLDGWEYNNGHGLDSQAACNSLASAIEAEFAPDHTLLLEIAGSVRVDNEGRMLCDGESGGRSPYGTSGDHILKFARFLRECGGAFEIT